MKPEKFSPSIVKMIKRIEAGRLDPGSELDLLQHFTNYEGWVSDRNGEWLLLSSKFSNAYMSELASMLAKETGSVALTDNIESMSIRFKSMIEDVKSISNTEKKGALISIVMEAIRIDPDTKIEKLLRFRRDREAQIAELSAQFDEMSSKIIECGSALELKETSRNIYKQKIHPKLQSLKSELSDCSIQSMWDGVHRAVTISVPAGGALSYFSGFTGTALLSAGAAISVCDLAVKTHLARKKAKRASPYAYLLDIDRKFSCAAYDDLAL